MIVLITHIKLFDYNNTDVRGKISNRMFLSPQMRILSIVLAGRPWCAVEYRFAVN